MRGLEEEFESINTEISILKLDLSHALNAPNSWLEEILSIVLEKDSATFVFSFFPSKGTIRKDTDTVHRDWFS